MDGHPGIVGEGDEKFLQHLRFKITDVFPGEGDIPNQGGAAADIDTDAAQGLIHGGELKGIAIDASLIAKSLGEGLTQQDADIL